MTIGQDQERNDADTPLGVTLAVTAIACVLIAGVLRFVVPSIGQNSFFSVLLHSLCIGLVAVLLTTAVTAWLDQRRLTSVGWLIALLMPVSASAFFIGSALAELLLGLPVEPFLVFADPGDTASLIATVVATAVCAGFFISKDQVSRLRLQARLQAARDGQRVDGARLAMLQAQVEPHMLFNTLANLRALIPSDPDRALVMLDQLDGFLRSTLQGSRNATHALASEFAGVEHYLSIMRIRLGSRLSYSLDLPDELAGLDVSPMLIQPLVENAIRHGIEPAVGGGHIAIAASRESNHVRLEVVDTGVGFSSPTMHPHNDRLQRPCSGFGLQSLHERLPDVDGWPGVQTISPLPGRANGSKVTLRVRA